MTVCKRIAKDKQRPAFGIFAQPLLGRRPQPVEVHPQIARRGRQEHLELRVKTQHGRPSWRICSSRAASGNWAGEIRRNRAAPISITNSDGGAGEANST